MTRMRSSMFVLVLLAGCAGAADKPPVEVKVATYKALTDAIAAQKGKIVVLDAWGTFCLPCKKEFHNLVEIHQRHAKDGVVCMSVAVFPFDKADALKFLKEKGAAFANFALAEEDESIKLQEEWRFGAVPAVFVFDRDGNRRDFTMEDPKNQFTYDDIRKHLATLLKR
jgi:thiol-disulfide isomerase/thioredoxin